MQNISDLIKEAKPLYMARKKRNKNIKIASLAIICGMFAFALVPTQKEIEDFSWWDLGYGEAQSELTYVENFDLPVDDYGLLLVS